MQRLHIFSKFGLRAAASALSPAGRKASLLVLIYHRVLAQADPLMPDEPDAQRFAAHADLLATLFNVLPLPEAVAKLKEGTLPARAAVITFDDGYTNNLTVAAPILAARKLPATVFVASGFSNGGRMWNDTIFELVRAAPRELDLSKFNLGRFELGDVSARRRAVSDIIDGLKYLQPDLRQRTVDTLASHVGAALPTDLMMTPDQIKKLHLQGIEIGAHTVMHPILTKLDDDAARAEILNGKRQLEEIIGAPVTSFAYPNGRPRRDYMSNHVRIVRECKFERAVSTAWGAARKNFDEFQVPRIAPWDRTALRFGARMLKAYVDRQAEVV